MTFSIQLHQRTQRRKRQLEEGKEVFLGLLEPFVLESVYPKVWLERGGEGSGDWHEDTLIQPHQRLVHEGVPPSERKRAGEDGPLAVGKQAKFTLFSGGVGSGKSLMMCCEIVRQARIYPGIKIMVVTAFDWYYDMFLMPIFWSVFPEENNHHKKSYNVKSRLLRFVNGSQIQFKAFDEAGKIKGWDAHVIWIEEGSELGDRNNEKATDIFMALCMRHRSTRPAYPLRMFMTQNPLGHNWLWKLFIKEEPGKPQPLGDVGRKTIFGHTKTGEPKCYYEWEKIDEATGDIYYTVATGSTANAFIPVGYINSMLGAMADSPGLRQRMVEGLFTPINSLVYDWPIYSERTHLVDYSDFLRTWEISYIPPWWPVIVGIDTGGARSPWAVEFYAQVPDETHWVCFDEIYQSGSTWDEIAELILEKSNRFTDHKGEKFGFDSITYSSDPISSKQAQGPVAEKIKEWFEERGIPTEQPKHYSKGGGIEHVRAFLKPDQRYASPYHANETQMTKADGTIYYEMGQCGIYYLTNVPGKNLMVNAAGDFINPRGHAAPGNIAEKRVYRRDNSKQRPMKEAEEGLSPFQSEKVIDRDDHAQTAEMFTFLVKYPLDPDAVNRKNNQGPRRPDTPYGHRVKNRRE